MRRIKPITCRLYRVNPQSSPTQTVCVSSIPCFHYVTIESVTPAYNKCMQLRTACTGDRCGILPVLRRRIIGLDAGDCEHRPQQYPHDTLLADHYSVKSEMKNKRGFSYRGALVILTNTQKHCFHF